MTRSITKLIDKIVELNQTYMNIRSLENELLKYSDKLAMEISNIFMGFPHLPHVRIPYKATVTIYNNEYLEFEKKDVTHVGIFGTHIEFISQGLGVIAAIDLVNLKPKDIINLIINHDVIMGALDKIIQKYKECDQEKIVKLIEIVKGIVNDLQSRATLTI